MNYCYTSMRPLPQLLVSSREQNNSIRNYCHKIGLSFTISVPELVYPFAFVQLFSIAQRACYGDTITFFSLSQFFDYRNSFDDLSQLLISSFQEVHFANEFLSCSSQQNLMNYLKSSSYLQ